MNPTEQRVVDLVRSYVGCSLDDSTEDKRLRRAALAQLVARQVDDPESVVTVKSNCGMFALGIWKLLGIEHQLLRKKYVNAMAMGWITRIGNDLGFRHAYQGDPSVLRPGALLFYRTVLGAISKEHVEFLLGELDEHHEADHAGGGRPRNAIVEAHGPVLRSSWAGPLWVYFDVPGLLERMAA
jgi:hypothetical protein